VVDGKPLTEWMPLAKSEARKALVWCSDLFTVDELVSIASLELVRAASMWRKDRHRTFGSYCKRGIRWQFKNARKRKLFFSPSRNPMPQPKMHTDFLERVKDESVATPLDSAISAELLEFVKDTLPRRKFDILKLHVIDGYTFREIGQLFGMSGQNVFRIYKASLESLRRKIVFGRKGFLCPV